MLPFKINNKCKIVLSENTMVGQIATIMINKHSRGLSNYSIENLPLEGHANIEYSNVIYVECGYPRRILNSLKNNNNKVKVVNTKKTDSVLRSLWITLFPRETLPQFIELLEDLLDEDPETDDGYSLMCYVQDNFKTIDGLSFFDRTLEDNLIVARKFVGM